MYAIRSDVGSPFLPTAPTDADAAEQRRPPGDDEAMRRLRTPFEADPFDVPKQPCGAVFDNDDPRGTRGRRAPLGRDRG
jgi:hypothetical protein